MNIERMIAALAAMITQCVLSAHSQTLRMAMADSACVDLARWQRALAAGSLSDGGAERGGLSVAHFA